MLPTNTRIFQIGSSMLVLMVMSSDPKCGCLKVAILVDGKSQFFTVLIFLDVTTLSKNYYRIMIMLT